MKRIILTIMKKNNLLLIYLKIFNTIKKFIVLYLSILKELYKHIKLF